MPPRPGAGPVGRRAHRGNDGHRHAEARPEAPDGKAARPEATDRLGGTARPASKFPKRWARRRSLKVEDKNTIITPLSNAVRNRQHGDRPIAAAAPISAWRSN